jgi:hypothetical protein
VLWTGLILLSTGTSGGGGCWDHGDEPRVPQIIWEFVNSLATAGFSRRAQLHGDS